MCASKAWKVNIQVRLSSTCLKCVSTQIELLVVNFAYCGGRTWSLLLVLKCCNDKYHDISHKPGDKHPCLDIDKSVTAGSRLLSQPHLIKPIMRVRSLAQWFWNSSWGYTSAACVTQRQFCDICIVKCDLEQHLWNETINSLCLLPEAADATFHG